MVLKVAGTQPIVLVFPRDLWRLWPEIGYASRMALVRILVDGYSLLHHWSEVAPGKPRHSAVARQELIHALTRYRDASGTPVTVVFDGSSATPALDEVDSTSGVEILYSRAGQTADQVIERAAYRLKEYGEVLVVTDDSAERDTVMTFGAMASSCENFVRTVRTTLHELEREITHHNRQERARYAEH